jgi:riboflavin synthase
MFTGIIEQAGEVKTVRVSPEGARLEVAAGPLAAGVRIGDSVAVNGACLTVVRLEGERLSFDAVNETLRRTNLGALSPGERVNLERPLAAGGRLDGHIVQGHVDAVAALAGVSEEGDSRRLRFQAPEDLLRFVVEKGSIAVDGISLTVAAVGGDWFEVVIIPHTWEVTNLGARRPGDRVNLEVDILAKYVARLLQPHLAHLNPTPNTQHPKP